jgi:hypothetical protein
VIVQPSGVETPEEVLVIVDPIHQDIPAALADTSPVFLAPDAPKPAAPPEADPAVPNATPQPATGRGQMTQADKLLDQYRKIGEAQKFTYGEGGPGSTPPNFNIKLQQSGAQPATGAAGANPAGPKPTAPAATNPITGTPGLVRPPAATSPATGTIAPQPRPQTTGGVAPPPGTTGTRPPAAQAPGSVPQSAAPPASTPKSTPNPNNAPPVVIQVPAPKPAPPTQPTPAQP